MTMMDCPPLSVGTVTGTWGTPPADWRKIGRNPCGRKNLYSKQIKLIDSVIKSKICTKVTVGNRKILNFQSSVVKKVSFNAKWSEVL